MKSQTRRTRLIGFAVMFAASAIAQQAAMAGATGSARVTLLGGGCVTPGRITDGIQTPGENSVAAVAGDGAGGCTASAQGFGYGGVVGASGRAIFASDYPLTDIDVSGVGSGSWAESISVSVPRLDATRPGEIAVNIDRLQVNYSFGASGSSTAVGSRNSEGRLLAGGTASSDYTFNIGSNRHTGFNVASAFSMSVQGGQGTIAGSIGITPQFDADGVVTFAQIPFRMQATASAGVGNLFVAGFRNAVSNANFSSTLRWTGVTSVQAFDALGREVALVPDFRLLLIGNESGVDYWNAAPLRNLFDVPVPSTYALLAAGMFGLIALRRRQTGVC